MHYNLIFSRYKNTIYTYIIEEPEWYNPTYDNYEVEILSGVVCVCSN